MSRHFVFVVAIFFSIFLTLPRTVFAASWLSGYGYQKVFNINGSPSGAVSDYPVKVTLNRTAGVDVGSTFYLGSNVLSSFDDIRFTSEDGVTLLSYWIESVDSKEGTATVWVKLDSVPVSPGQKTFYLYYGNNSAPSLSSSADTFSFFESFDTDGISSWTGSIQNLHTGESATQNLDTDVRFSAPNSANLYTHANCSRPPFDGIGSLISRSPNLPSGNYKVEFQVIREIIGFVYSSTAIERSTVLINGSVGITGTATCDGYGCTVPRNVWESESFDVVNSPITTIGLQGYSDDCTEGNVWFDNVRIRNFISPEPSLSQSTNQDDSTSDSTTNSVSVSLNSAPTCNDTKPVSTPDLFQIDATSTSAKLFFTPISNTSQFFVSFSETINAEKHGEQTTLLREGVQSHSVYHLKPNTTYYFKVRGQIGCMPGDWSNVMKIITRSNGLTTPLSTYRYTFAK